MGKTRAERRKMKQFEAKKRKLAKKKFNDYGDLIDMSQEMFETYIEEKKLSLGETKLLHQGLTAIYFDLNAKKDGLIECVNSCEDDSDRKSLVDTINRVFLVMMRVENKCAFLYNRIQRLMDDFKAN